MGLLRSAGPPDWHPASQELKSAVSKCVDVCSQYNMELSDIAIRYAFEISFLLPKPQDAADGYVMGMLGADQVSKSLDALRHVTSSSQTNRSNKFNPEENSENICTAKVLEILKPFSNYTWESPPSDA
ncbi:L-galactose dehydrogenase [Smittium mucronatum]|uniref:L-galactose dehydrogenase n=1 Tax=Smittium mucronatum TaxID=133383 RepID=A0A1R0H740_9FUNG|nr:L-galactose dehydrogenase [Smittium mucronatum]